MARPFAVLALGVALVVFALSRVVGFGTSPQTAFLFFIGYGSAVAIALVALAMTAYRPGLGAAISDGPISATLVAPFGMLALLANAGVAADRDALDGWFIASTAVIGGGCIAAFVVGRIGHRALCAADSAGCRE